METYGAVEVRRCADKSLYFPISYFPICSTTKGYIYILDELEKLEQRSHKCVELKGKYVE
jgi:hypothetical protein